MSGLSTSLCVRVAAGDGRLASALGEQRSATSGWRIAPFGQASDAPLESDAIVIVDFDGAAAQRAAVDSARGQGFNGPILLLGGDAATCAPTDEAVARPVRLGALLARINAHGAVVATDGATSLGPYELAASEYALREIATGRLVRLTELELKLIDHLLEARGELVGREQLLRQVWGYSPDADTHTVETHIWRLRQKIETDDPATRIVVTETGGYRLALAASARPG